MAIDQVYYHQNDIVVDLKVKHSSLFNDISTSFFVFDDNKNFIGIVNLTHQTQDDQK